MKIKRNNETAGFTLIDLMVSMVVIGIGLAIAVPAMRDFTNVNRQAEEINKLVRDITYAKSEAVTRGCTTAISQTGGTAGNWYDGWQVTACDGTVLRTAAASTLPSITLVEASALTTIGFKASGTTTTAVSFLLCDPTTQIDNVDKQLDISVTGRINLNAQHDCTP